MKRGSEDIIELEGEIDQSSKRPRFSKIEKEPVYLVGSSSTTMGFQLQLGDATCTPSSPVPKETSKSVSLVIKQLYGHILEINRRVKESIESHLEVQSISEYHTKLLFAMDVERNQLKLSFSHPFELSILSS